MDHNPEDYSSLRREFVEAAVKYEDAGYKTFIQRTVHSEKGYHETGRYDCVAEIKWPYRPWRKCWILAPSSGTNEEPFAAMKTLFTKAWLWLPRVVAGRIVNAAEWQLSPRVDVGLLWAKSHYEFWCWLLWFDWLWRCGEVETEEPEFQPAGMDLRPFSSSVELIARWGLDGSAGTFPLWLSLPDTKSAGGAAAERATDRLTTTELAMLAGVGKPRLLNVLSEARTSGDPDLPEPIIRGSGSLDDQYRYSAIRPLLRRKWPARDGAGLFPDSFGDVKAWLSAQEPND